MRRDTLGSAYGKKSVQIGVIGQNYSTFIHHNICTYRLTGGGTSNSAPIISGVSGLKLSINPKPTPEQIINIIIKTVPKEPLN